MIPITMNLSLETTETGAQEDSFLKCCKENIMNSKFYIQQKIFRNKDKIKINKI